MSCLVSWREAGWFMGKKGEGEEELIWCVGFEALLILESYAREYD